MPSLRSSCPQQTKFLMHTIDKDDTDDIIGVGVGKQLQRVIPERMTDQQVRCLDSGSVEQATQLRDEVITATVGASGWRALACTGLVVTAYESEGCHLRHDFIPGR